MHLVRRSAERGHLDHGWLDTYHSFSFATYYDPRYMGFRCLRVINEDVIAAGTGFGRHGHRDMEIITVVLEGQLAHRDSLGSGSTIQPGQVQRMTAGTGIMHSEANPSPSEPVHLLQIWIEPEQEGLPPSYEEWSYDPAERKVLLASRHPAGQGVLIHQDARLWHGRLHGDLEEHPIAEGRHLWLQVISGSLRAQGVDLEAGDALAVSEEPVLTLQGEGRYLLFDLP